ncbi:TonB family protein [Roseomonas sp. GCM10028921]
MRAGALALAFGTSLLFANLAHAQPQRGKARPAACDLSGAPDACGSCPSLAASLPLVSADRLSSGPMIDDVLWTPLYVAQRLNCLDVGLTLLRRGADPNLGGRDSALIVEVARSAGTDGPGQTRIARRSRAMDWLHRLGRYALDVDARLPNGSTNRAAWTSAGISDPDAKDVWSYAGGLSAAQPALAHGAQPGNPDLPAADIGVTRPSETAVARGVELFDLVFRESGMSGVTARLQGCWGERRRPELTRMQVRWSYEACGALDLASSSIHDAFLKQMPQAQPLDYFRAYNQEQRLQLFRQFAAEGLVPAAHRQAMARSMEIWLEIITFAERPRAVPPVLAGAPSTSGGGPMSPASLVEPAAQLTYPEAARRTGETGEVGLTLRVAEDGRVIAADIDRSSGFGTLDDAARMTALRWRFQSAKRDGVAVTTYPKVVATFSLTPAGSGRASMRVTGN